MIPEKTADPLKATLPSKLDLLDAAEIVCEIAKCLGRCLSRIPSFQGDIESLGNQFQGQVPRFQETTEVVFDGRMLNK